MQREWAWEIWAEAHGVPQFARAHVTITRYSAGSLDPDNLVGGVKALVDVLKPHDPKRNPWGQGLIAGDEADKLKLDVRQVKCKRAEACTVIEITEQTGE